MTISYVWHKAQQRNDDFNEIHLSRSLDNYLEIFESVGVNVCRDRYR